MTETLNVGVPDIELLHEAVMDAIGDYIDFEYSFQRQS